MVGWAGPWTRIWAGGFGVACCVLTLGATDAGATQRFVAPPPTGTGTLCTQPSPCPLEYAVETAAAANDEVIVAAGTYDLSAAELLANDAGLDLHGATGQARPTIISDGDVTLRAFGAGATYSDLNLVNTGTFDGIWLRSGGKAERLSVSGTGLRACELDTSATISNSTCFGSGGYGLYSNAITSGTITATNVTAIGRGPSSNGIWINAGAPGTAHTLELRNVVADGVVSDVEAFTTDPTASATVNTTSSNYATVSTGGPGTETITAPGTGTNQTAAPLFANLATGDLHELAGSPTINAGTVSPSTGTFDYEGQARVQGTAIDIGADEFPEAAPDTTAPATTIDKGPKVKTKSRNATFNFSSDDPAATFECKLDKGAFSGCSSPEAYKHLKRLGHRLDVRATDAAGNVDATPATYNWRIKKKHKRK